MKTTTTRNITIFEGSGRSVSSESLIVEEPLSIRIDGQPYSVVMRTPGDEAAHAAGFCLAEGIVEKFEDIAAIGFCDDDETNVLAVTLTAGRRMKVAGLLERKGFVSQTSCGICGKEVVNDLCQIISPLPFRHQLSPESIMASANTLPAFQPLHRRARAAHAAVLYDAGMNMLAFAEDVGRHNALDKAIGKVFCGAGIDQAVFALMSSRLSYELVQKAARAGIEIVAGISRPTALAVELAESVGMTLAWAGNERLAVFAGQYRISGYNEE